MLNLGGRNLRFSVFKTISVHRLFPRLSSSSPAAASDNSFTVSYLIDSCGFTPEKAISASSCLKFKTPDRADSVIAFFKDKGFTETQIYNMIRRYPAALKCHPQNNFFPKFDFFCSIGLSDSDVIKLFTANPTLLGRSLKKHILPTFNLLRDLLPSSDRTLNTISHFPWYIGNDYRANLAANIQLLQEIGVPRSNMLYVLTYQAQYLVGSTKLFKKAVEEVVEMGFDPLKSNFMLAVHAIMSMSKSSWEKKMETYKKWGWSEAQILRAFRTYPWCMKKSEEKIDKVMDYIVNKMGFETSVLAKNSILIGYSMEKRIIPRCLVYRYCLDNGLMNDKNYCGFSWWMRCSDKMFIKRLRKYEKTGVLKFYQEKLDHAN